MNNTDMFLCLPSVLQHDGNLKKIVDVLESRFNSLKETRNFMERIFHIDDSDCAGKLLDDIAKDYGITRDTETDTEIKKLIKLKKATRITNCTTPDIYTLLDMMFGTEAKNIHLLESADNPANITISYSGTSLNTNEIVNAVSALRGCGISINKDLNTDFRLSNEISNSEFGSPVGFDYGKWRIE